MDEADTGIQLNISGEPSSDLIYDLSTKKILTKIRGDRERIKASRKLTQKSLESPSLAHLQPKNVTNASRGEPGLKKKRSLCGKDQKDTAFPVAKKPRNENPVPFTSLFTNNPEIPTIRNSHMDSIKEAVFSSKSFDDLPLDSFMISNLTETLNLKQMTNVQQQAIPRILKGRDTLVKSQTGSGKTLAYAVPIVQSLQAQRPKIHRSDGPYALVIVPTRELAVQSLEAFQKLVKTFVWVVPGCLTGGEKRKSEKARIRKGINILIGTPGRLADHIQHTSGLLLSRISQLVIDEADRLLDMGFEKEVGLIINFLNEKGPKRQTILLSATLTKGVERLAGMSLTDPEQISISQDASFDTASAASDSLPALEIRKQNGKDAFTMPENLKQLFIITPCKLRLVTLAAFITWKCKLSSEHAKMIVFLSTQDSVEFHFNLFVHVFGKKMQPLASDDDSEFEYKDDEDDDDDDGIEFFKLYGDMPQKERTSAYQQFSEATSGVLFCTDVASRGLHLPSVKWIVQYTTPTGSARDYVHRVGRTARVGTQGNSLLFLMPAESKFLEVLSSYKISMQEIQMDKLLENILHLVPKFPKLQGSRREVPRTYQEAATTLQMHFEYYTQSNKNILEQATKAFQSFVRAYSTYPRHLKSMFHVKNLHLGHLAKSFGLQDSPKNFRSMQLKSGKKKKHKRRCQTHISEFDSGLDFPRKTKKSS